MKIKKEKLKIAIDSPAAAGAGTLAKKISILSDNNIANENITKIKLLKRYSLNTLINLIYYSSALSVVTLIIWLTTTKYIYFDNLQVLSLFISIIFYSIFH